MSFTAQDQSVYALFNRNCYRIPRNQRKYVWSQRNWQELFDDIMLVNRGVEQTHFIGSIVLFQEKDRENGISYYTIIDGQQRIMSLAIILSSIAFWLKCYSAESDFKGTTQYIVARDDSNGNHVMVTSECHMSLEQILKGITTTSLERMKKQTVDSFLAENTVGQKDRNIVKAFKFYFNQIHAAISKSNKPIEFLVKLRDTIVNKILYVSITATSEEDACTIFEILNARGAALEDHELLKNFIMQGLKPEGGIDQAKTLWAGIENDLGSHIGLFVKHYATHRYSSNSLQGSMSAYQLIRHANKGISTQELLLDIRKKASYYCKLISPDSSGECVNCTPTEYKVYSFFKKRRHEQIRPILLSLIHQKELGALSVDEYDSTILFLYDFFICYNIIGQENSNKITNTVYSMAPELENNYSVSLLQKFINSLNDKLPSKESFVHSFSTVGWSHHGGYYDDEKNKERVQIILEVFERHKNASGTCSEFTIEHVLDDCENTENGNIGNLIPLESQLNMQCAGKTFEEKTVIYQQSSFQTARNFSLHYKDKNGFNIQQRTKIMGTELYDQILKFKISNSKQKAKKVVSAPAPYSSSNDDRTIEEIINGQGSCQNILFEQLTLF